MVANALISPFHTRTMHIKSFYTQQHCYVSLKTLYPGGIRTRVCCLLGRCDVLCGTPPGHEYPFLILSFGQNFSMTLQETTINRNVIDLILVFITLPM
jgi:hypothetical protein